MTGCSFILLVLTLTPSLHLYNNFASSPILPVLVLIPSFHLYNIFCKLSHLTSAHLNTSPILLTLMSLFHFSYYGKPFATLIFTSSYSICTILISFNVTAPLVPSSRCDEFSA